MILVSEPVIGKKEIEYVNECLQTGWISSAGSYIEKFETSWAKYCGMSHGIACSNGSAALEIAIGAMNLKPGGEVIMPSFTIISCAQAITYNGLTPVLVDCEEDTWCIDVSKIEKKITSKTVAIMPVHMYGNPVDMDPLLALAKKHNLKIIEDAAQVHGGEYKGKKLGGLGDVSCFSFFANKIITTGEGGMVLTNSDEYAKKARMLRNLCFEPGRRFVHKELGYNYRLTNIQAAIGAAQVERIEELVQKKIEVGEYYLQGLKDVKGIKLPVEKSYGKNLYWMFGIVLEESTGETAETFALKMKELGVETRPFFLGMHEQPYYLKEGLFVDEQYPVTTRIARQGLYIPSGLNLTKHVQDTVIEAVKKCLAR